MKYILTDSETYGEMVAAPEPSTFGIEGHWLVEYVNRHTCGTEEGGHFGAHERGCGSLPALDLSQAEGWDRHVAAIRAEALLDTALLIERTCIGFGPRWATDYLTARAVIEADARADRIADLAAICPVPPFPHTDRIEAGR